MEFETIDLTKSVNNAGVNRKGAEFPLDWLAPNTGEPKTYIKTSKKAIYALYVQDYVNVPFCEKNLTEEEIKEMKDSLINAMKVDDRYCKQSDCIHIIRKENNGDIYHGFAILNAIKAPAGFAL